MEKALHNSHQLAAGPSKIFNCKRTPGAGGGILSRELIWMHCMDAVLAIPMDFQQEVGFAAPHCLPGT